MRALTQALALIAVAIPLLAQGPPRGSRRPAPGPSAIERYNSMPPRQRERILEKLPADRRKAFEDRVERYNRLSPGEKRRLRGQYDQFQQLPPERRDEARRVFRRFMNLPEDRQRELRTEMETLRDLAPDERRQRVESPPFMEKFSPQERRMMRDLGRTLSPPADTGSQHEIL